MNISTLTTRICNDIVHRVARRGFRDFIVTNFKYPDGDKVVIYPDFKNKRVKFSDGGFTSYKLRLESVRLSDRRKEMIDSVCRLYGTRFTTDQAIEKVANPDTVGSDFIELCEAILRISNLEYAATYGEPSKLYRQLDAVIVAQVQAKRNVLRNWYADCDEKNSHPVDYRCNGKKDTRHVFHVATPVKAEQVVGICYYLKGYGIDFPTLVVTDSSLALGRERASRLEEAVDGVLSGVKDNEERITSFCLSSQ